MQELYTASEAKLRLGGIAGESLKRLVTDGKIRKITPPGNKKRGMYLKEDVDKLASAIEQFMEIYSPVRPTNKKPELISVALNREDGGRLVRDAWIRWARQQPNPKPSWLVEWDDLPEADKEADRCIWDEVSAPYLQAINALHARIQSLQHSTSVG